MIPRCTAAVSVETGTAAKAGHWETEKVGIRAQEYCSLYASQKTDDRSVHRKAARTQAVLGVFLLQEFGCSEKSLQPFFVLGGTMENKEQTLNPTEQTILEALRNLDYGEITITVHNGKPTIMEVSKKIKF